MLHITTRAWGRYPKIGCALKCRTGGENAPEPPPSAQAPNDPGLVQIIRRHLHANTVPHGDSHPPLAHLSRNCREHPVPVVEHHAEHCSRQDALHLPLHFYMFFRHAAKQSNQIGTRPPQKGEPLPIGPIDPQHPSNRPICKCGMRARRRLLGRRPIHRGLWPVGAPWQADSIARGRRAQKSTPAPWPHHPRRPGCPPHPPPRCRPRASHPARPP